MSEVVALRKEMAELRDSNVELRGMLQELIAAAAV